MPHARSAHELKNLDELKMKNETAKLAKWCQTVATKAAQTAVERCATNDRNSLRLQYK